MRAVVLARGAGRRMQVSDESAALSTAQSAAASAGLKCLVPVGEAHRPFLDYVISALADVGCLHVCLVVAPDHGPIRRAYVGVRTPSRVALTFAVQEIADGTAHALLAAELFAGDEPFLVLNADNLYPGPVLRDLVGLDGPGLAAFERHRLAEDSGFAEDRAAAFALLEVDGTGHLRRIVEKPGRAAIDAAGPRALVSMNLWRFDRRIFQPCREVPPSTRGEYELPEAVALALERGSAFRVVAGRGPVLDLSHQADIAVVSRRLGRRQVWL